MKSILDPSFRYTASFDTDLQKTFARVRREEEKEVERGVRSTADALAKVSSIVKKPATALMSGVCDLDSSQRPAIHNGMFQCVSLNRGKEHA